MWCLPGRTSCYPYFSSVQSPRQNVVGPEQLKLLDQVAPSPATDAIGLLPFDAPTLQSLVQGGRTVYPVEGGSKPLGPLLI